MGLPPKNRGESPATTWANSYCCSKCIARCP